LNNQVSVLCQLANLHDLIDKLTVSILSVGRNPDQNPVLLAFWNSYGTQGAFKSPLTTEWLPILKLNLTVSPGFAVTFGGANEWPAPPTSTSCTFPDLLAFDSQFINAEFDTSAVRMAASMIVVHADVRTFSAMNTFEVRLSLNFVFSM
jgi:hypothetical protein